MYQKIEQLIGKKLDQYEAEQDAVLMLLERVSESQRMATMQVLLLSLGCPAVL